MSPAMKAEVPSAVRSNGTLYFCAAERIRSVTSMFRVMTTAEG